MAEPAGPVTVNDADARKVAFGAFVGTALEWYDFFLFGTAASLVFNHLFFAGDDAVVATAGCVRVLRRGLRRPAARRDPVRPSR